MVGKHTMRQHKRSRHKYKYKRNSRRKNSNKSCPTFPHIYNCLTDISPGKNFFQYINGNWINKTHLTEKEVSRSVSSELQKIIDIHLIKYIHDAIKHPKTTDDYAIKSLIHSYLKKDRAQITVRTLKEELNKLQCINTKSDICRILGTYAFNGTCNLINVYDGPEEERSKHLRLHFAPARTGLPSEDYYLKNMPHEKRIFNSYKNLLKTIDEELQLDGQLELFADYEKKYAHIIQESRDEENTALKGHELINKYNEFDWPEFFNAFGYKNNTNWHNEIFIIDSHSWMNYLNKLLKTFDINEWRILLQGTICMCYMSFLNSKVDKQAFYTFNYLLGGQTKQLNKLTQSLILIKKYLQIPLSRLYFKHTHSAGFRNEIKKFINSLQDSAIERINETEWLDEKTRKAAIKKVQNIHLGVLYMTESYNFTVPKLCDNIIENIQKINSSLVQKSIKDVEKKYTTQKWDVPIYAVNAYYLAAGNRLVIPSAIVNHPFYCSYASAGSNYGALGAVIGHEITHAFDDYGKDFDEHGNRAEWWSTSDKRRYTMIVDKIIKLYNKTKLYGRHVNGENTLGENIADLGGLAISLNALKKYMDAENYDCNKRQENIKDFFSSYATSWLEKERRARGIYELIVDVHSPAIIRVNNIVPHFQEWYDAYDITEKDDMYIAPENRLRIF